MISLADLQGDFCLSEEEAKQAMEILEREPEQYTYGPRPGAAQSKIDALNELIGGFGVEMLLEPDFGSRQGEQDGELRYEYINTGDTYSVTIGWDEQEQEFLISTHGDLVESMEKSLRFCQIEQCSRRMEDVERYPYSICGECMTQLLDGAVSVSDEELMEELWDMDGKIVRLEPRIVGSMAQLAMGFLEEPPQEIVFVEARTGRKLEGISLNEAQFRKNASDLREAPENFLGMVVGRTEVGSGVGFMVISRATLEVDGYALCEPRLPGG